MNFERQYSPEWGRRPGQKRYGVIFDFALVDLSILIERDGEQHYFPVRFGGIEHDRTKKLFQQQVAQDLHKTELAKRNDWRVCRIPYFCDDVAAEVLYILSGKPTYPDEPAARL